MGQEVTGPQRSWQSSWHYAAFEGQVENARMAFARNEASTPLKKGRWSPYLGRWSNMNIAG